MLFYNDPTVADFYQDANVLAMAAMQTVPEEKAVQDLLNTLTFSAAEYRYTTRVATALVQHAREQQRQVKGMAAFMAHYDLTTDEGILLMALAEALLRIPDRETALALIRDQLTAANWSAHLSQCTHFDFVKLSTLALKTSSRWLQWGRVNGNGTHVAGLWQRLMSRMTAPIVMKAVHDAIQMMSQQYVLGETIQVAIKNTLRTHSPNRHYSYDMLGEAACCEADAEQYFNSYLNAIQALGEHVAPEDLAHSPARYLVYQRDGVSVKLSALHPRYALAQAEQMLPVLTTRVLKLARAAKAVDIPLTIDAEEVDRLDISLMLFKAVFEHPDLADWPGLGLAIQAYQKRALGVIRYITALAANANRTVHIRLVKGAYWDYEIKLAQQMGVSEYPVFTRKVSTDVNYLTCASWMLQHNAHVYCQFATHNAQTLATLLCLMRRYRVDERDVEFQRLHGMGEWLYQPLMSQKNHPFRQRIYAPVGAYRELLPYLVRRLLENGANNSFVNQINHPAVTVTELVAHPLPRLAVVMPKYNPAIPLPPDLYGLTRKNAVGVDLTQWSALTALSTQVEQAMATMPWSAGDSRAHLDTASIEVHNPAHHQAVVGTYAFTSEEAISTIMQTAQTAYPAWSQRGVTARAALLQTLATLLEKNLGTLVAMAIQEAGKTLASAVNEVREAVDFCRYYANHAETLMATQTLPGPTGEANTLHITGRGVFVCISPWNFPVAIFTGQVVAALVTGNTVVAKPAEQTALVAAKVAQLAYDAGVPKAVLQLVFGPGETVGNALVSHPLTAGVAFTGSTTVAHHIQRQLIQPHRPIVPLIAETGGVNAMIVDSSALPEQVVHDVLQSAFDSAGQRCSACRVLMIQDSVAPRILSLLAGAMATLVVGDPMQLSTDVGPVIDREAQERLLAHIAQLKSSGATQIAETPVDPAILNAGTFVAPYAFQIHSFDPIKTETFGPVLHVMTFQRKHVHALLDEINGLGYGLTFGVHSRIPSFIDTVVERIRVGNVYVNRNMIGAVVGCQPFGGCGLSGTGPKAGGPHYLMRFCHEKTVSVNTVAMGGNVSLMRRIGQMD